MLAFEFLNSLVQKAIDNSGIKFTMKQDDPVKSCAISSN